MENETRAMSQTKEPTYSHVNITSCTGNKKKQENHCTAHDQARQESWPNLHYQSHPRCLWSFMERIGAVTHPPIKN